MCVHVVEMNSARSRSASRERSRSSKKDVLQLKNVARSALRNRVFSGQRASHRFRPDSSEIAFDLLKLHSLATDHAVHLPSDRLKWQLLKRIVNELDDLVCVHGFQMNSARSRSHSRERSRSSEKVILQLTPVAKSALRNRKVPRPCSSERSRPDSSEIEFDLLKLHSLVTDHAVDLPCDKLNWQLLKRIVNELDELVGAA